MRLDFAATLQQQITVAFTAKKLITISTAANLDGNLPPQVFVVGKDRYTIAYNHAMAVINATPTTISIYNPWGKQFTMTYDDAIKYFRTISIT